MAEERSFCSNFSGSWHFSIISMPRSKRGQCKRTGQPHIQLCGQTPTGQWMTHIAEPYPFKLCHVLAQAFAGFEAQIRANNFQKREAWLPWDKLVWVWICSCIVVSISFGISELSGQMLNAT